MVSRLLSLKRGISNPIFQGPLGNLHSAHAALLRATQSKVAVFDNRQELFGLAVTRNLGARSLDLDVVFCVADPRASLILNGLPRQHLEGSLDLIDRMFNNAAAK